MYAQTLKRGFLYAFLAAALGFVPVVAASAQSYDGETVQPNEEGNYEVAATANDTVTLANLGDSGASLELTFANGASGTVEVTTSTTAPSEATSAVPGTAAVYLDIDLNGLTNDDISGAVYTFSVTKDWLRDQGLESDNVFLYHWNGSAWERLSTTEIGETDSTHTYEAVIDNFSPFAVSGVLGLSNTGSPAFVLILVGSSLIGVVTAVAFMSRKSHAKA